MTEQTTQPTTQQQVQQKPDLGPELNLKLHVAEINFLLSVLGKVPYEQVEGLISKIRLQAHIEIAAISAPKE